MVSHPNRSKQPIPVYAKGGFKMREQTPLGFASSHEEAAAIARKHVKTLAGGANGHEWEVSFAGIALEKDDEGRYYVAKRRMNPALV